MMSLPTYGYFSMALALAYAGGMAVLVRELRTSTVEERRENQTVPLLIATTVLYAVVEIKTYQLMQMCGVL